MKVLVINSGSSSLKYQFIITRSSKAITKGLVEKIGDDDSNYSYYTRDGEKIKTSVKVSNHKEAIELVIKNLLDKENDFIESIDDIQAIGHRVVHGGEEFSGSVLINDKVIASIKKYAELAPLHNPANLQGIVACSEILLNKPQVAVFDTAFHQTMPESSYLYGIPYNYYKKYGVRRYGFHGTSHRYVMLKAAEYLNKPVGDINCISCHLGNGSSITAIKNGKSIDTSMGFTPLEGLIMGTRCGNIDPAIILFLMDKEGLSTSEVNTILNKKSGLLGLSGISNDLREISREAKTGNKIAQITREALVKSIRKYIGAYMAEIGRIDAIIFTAGIGENDYGIRKKAVDGLESYGIKMDFDKNESVRSEFADLSDPASRVKILLIPTNEELMIALETNAVINES